MDKRAISTSTSRPWLVTTAIVLAMALTMPSSISAEPSTVVKVNGTDLFCELDTPQAGLFLFAITRDRTDDGSFAFVDLAIEPRSPEAPTIVGGKDDPALTPTGFHDAWDVVDDGTGDLAGSASVDANFIGTGKYQVRRVYQDAAQMAIFEGLDVSGRLHVATTDATYDFDLSGCEAFTQHNRVDMAHRPNGPKPDATPPANDEPGTATPLTVGSRVQQSTGGASADAEAPCFIGDGDDAFEFGLGRTVWFEIAGTGSSITVDPRGSDFDTVVAVYAVTATGLENVGCVDDDDVGQAQGLLTFDTSPGMTYRIQIGGVIGNLLSDDEVPQWGRLRLAIS